MPGANAICTKGAKRLVVPQYVRIRIGQLSILRFHQCAKKKVSITCYKLRTQALAEQDNQQIHTAVFQMSIQMCSHFPSGLEVHAEWKKPSICHSIPFGLGMPLCFWSEKCQLLYTNQLLLPVLPALTS